MTADSAADDPASADDLGGDPVCWLDRVCPDCGAFLPDGPDHGCPRCADAPETPMVASPGSDRA